MHFKAVGEGVGGRFWLAEVSAAKGSGPPMHVHSNEDELWYVLGGEVSFFIGDDVATVGPGSVVCGPRDVPHTYKVESPTARLFGLATPAGFEHFFRESSRPAETLTVPPQMSSPDMASVDAELGRLGTRIVGPLPAGAPRGAGRLEARIEALLRRGCTQTPTY
ncbi:cupin domain-containing protein [Acrocarpospora phusangensis]|nr:cupin domain-containing protein [Acrocarpospora phusangensis]